MARRKSFATSRKRKRRTEPCKNPSLTLPARWSIVAELLRWVVCQGDRRRPQIAVAFSWDTGGDFRTEQHDPHPLTPFAFEDEFVPGNGKNGSWSSSSVSGL